MFRSAAAASARSPRRSGLIATQVTQLQIFSPDTDLADQPTPLAAGAGGAAALQRSKGVTLRPQGPGFEPGLFTKHKSVHALCASLAVCMKLELPFSL